MNDMIRIAPYGRRCYVCFGYELTCKKILCTISKSPIIWDAMTGKEIVKLQGHNNAINDAMFSPDGKMVVTIYQDHFRDLTKMVRNRISVVLHINLTSDSFEPKNRILV